MTHEQNLSSSGAAAEGPIIKNMVMAAVPHDYSKARNHIMDIFQALLSDPDLAQSSGKHLATLKAMSNSLPPSFKPTKAQLSIPHFYGIDLIASPSLRDKLIDAGTDIARSFLNDFSSPGTTGTGGGGGIVEASTAAEEPSSPSGVLGLGAGAGQLTVWGDDFDNEMAWEFSDVILERWGWLLGREWLDRANFFRRQRGAEPLPAELW